MSSMGIRTGTIAEEDLDKLFHIDFDNLGDRAIPQMPVYDPDYDGEHYRDWGDDSNWYMWAGSPDGELTRIRGYPFRHQYFGIESAADDDVFYPSLDFFNQHLCWPGVMDTISRTMTDVRHLAACMSKLALYQQISDVAPYEIQHFVVTEIEYIFSVCRSLYDLIQHLAWKIWNGVELHEGGWNELPRDSFASMALSGDEPVPAEDLTDTYGLPPRLAEFYESEAEFFAIIRDFRDDVMHYGETIQLVFVTEEGFAVRSTMHPFCEFEVWDEDTFLENDLAPLWPPVAHVILHTIGALNRFVDAFASDIGVLPRIAPDYQVYLRGTHVPNLTHLDSLVEDDIWGEQLLEERDVQIPIGE